MTSSVDRAALEKEIKAQLKEEMEQKEIAMRAEMEREYERKANVEKKAREKEAREQAAREKARWTVQLGDLQKR